MIEDIKAHLEHQPFIPFSIQMNDGRSIDVPHRDHVSVMRFVVVVEDGAGTVRVLPARNVSGITFATNGGQR